MVTGMTFLTRTAIKISRNLLLLEFSCLNEWIIVVKCSELRLKFKKKNQNKSYFLHFTHPPNSFIFVEYILNENSQ